MQHANHPDHARHDTTLIAGHAAGDLTEAERRRADSLLAACGLCGDLRRDLVAIAAATRSGPAPMALARDLRLTSEQADRLRRGSWLRTFLRPFANASSPIRPMATAFTSLGVVGLVVGITMSSIVGAPGSPASGGSSGGDANAPAPAATSAAEIAGGSLGEANPLAQSTADRGNFQQFSASPPRAVVVDQAGKSTRPSLAALAARETGTYNDGGAGAEAPDEARVVPAQSPSSMILAGSLALLGMGLLLFGLRIAGRRVR